VQTYLVGGAVRDQMLGREIKERDYVVVGATEGQMLAQGFTRVGRDFPVFLHPETKEEYALARTERKRGYGYTGFVCHASPDVTLEQDLLRRDLTINAMALDDNGSAIDPYNGKADLEDRIFRHVSPAFAEDPLRIFRVARFMARYKGYGFSIAEETLAIMQTMCTENEVRAISAERIWQETQRALCEPYPLSFFAVLASVGGLDYWFTEWRDIDFSSPTFSEKTSAITDTNIAIEQRFAVLVYLTLQSMAAKEISAENNNEYVSYGLALVADMQSRLKLPNSVADLARTIVQESSVWIDKSLPSVEHILQSLNRLDVWRNHTRHTQLAEICGLLFEDLSEHIDMLKSCIAKAKEVDVQAIIKSGKKGAEIKTALVEARKQAIKSQLDKTNGLG
jgi:tRNA nucleotidyltransferase (CCA-adding enzyme)